MMEQLFEKAIQELKNNDFELFEKTVTTPAVINFKDKDKRTLLFHAIIDDRYAFFDLLIKNGAYLNIVDRHGYSPLHYAINEYRVEMVKYLIENGANIEMYDSYGNNVIARAVLTAKGRTEIIKYLLDKGANPNIPNYKGYTAIDIANVIGNKNIIDESGLKTN